MRAVASENCPRNDEDRNGSRPTERSARLRKTRLRSLALEPLEARTLLSTLPQLTTNPSLNALVQGTAAGNTGNQVNPSVAIDPNDPLKMVAVWTRDDAAHPLATIGGTAITAWTQGAYSTNGGLTWSGLPGSLTNTVPDFSATPATTVLPTVTDATVAFDANNNFFIADEAHKADYSVGQINTERYSFAGGIPIQTLADNAVKQWTSLASALFKPVIAADHNQATANGQTDPATAFTPISGGTYGAVYVALQTSLDTANPPLQSSTIQLLTSIDGAQTFGTATLSARGNGSGNSEEASSPSLTVSQGNTAGTVSAGQVTAVWDDSGSNPNNNDVIRSNTLTYDSVNRGSAANLNAPILSPPLPTLANLAITPVVNTYNLPISGAPNSFSLVNLTAAVNLTYNDPTNANLGGVSVQLVAPSGQSIFLLKNGVTQSAANVNNAVVVTNNLVTPLQGITVVNPAPPPANIVVPNSGVLSTTFNDDAAQSIKGSDGSAATYTAEGNNPGFGQNLTSIFGGLTTGQVNGTWKLVVTSYLNGASGTLNSFGLRITGSVIGTENQVVALNPNGGVRGATNGANFPNAATYLPVPVRGIDPAPVVTSDNTLGGFSQFQGRLYVAYVDRYSTTQVTGNPADNTDIFLVHSDDGGATWSTPVKVNDDNSNTDGFSEGTRPQFQPAVAVDPASGTLAVSFFDARNDAARARVANYVALSTDGGGTFAPETYVNTPQQATDAITGNTVTLGPVPDNEAAASGTADTNFEFGDRQGLIFNDGQLIPVWASNLNGGVNIANGLTNTQLLQITVAHAYTSIGPRVLSVTQGPVGTTVGVGSGGTADALNPNPSTTSGPQFTAFRVVFDRPIEAASFHANNVTVTYVDVNGNSSTYSGGFTITPVAASAVGSLGYTRFTVTLNAPQTKAGTYSIRIAPNPTANGANDIRTRVQYYNSGSLVSYEYMDQAASNPANAGLAANAFQSPDPNNALITFPVIVPGPHIIDYKVSGGSGLDDLVLNPATPTTYVDITFDRNMNPATLVGHPEVILRMMGPAGQINDNFTITQPNAANLTTYRITFLNPSTSLPDPQTLDGTYTITLAPTVTDAAGNALDTNLNAGLYKLRGSNPYGTASPVVFTAAIPAAGLPIPDPAAPVANTLLAPITVPASFLTQGVSVKLNITYPVDTDLSATLLGPGAVVNPDGSITGPHARLFANVGGAGAPANFTDTVFSDTAAGVPAIQNGSAPFFGTFSPLDTFTSLTGIQAKGTWQLYIQDSSGRTGTLNSWSLTLLNNVASTASSGLGEPVADQATVSFRVIVDTPSVAQSSNTWTSAGPAPIVSGTNRTGRVGGLAVDPSDPSGNTVYAGGASGGVWKTTNFLTSSMGGPTWIPLTDFAPTSDNNIGGLTVFGVNNDPNQSIIFAGTGEGDTSTPGKGFVRSVDGGANWVWLDSTDNSVPYAQRDHLFANNSTYTYQIVADPHLSTNGKVIVYTALSGSANTAGIWRSLDSGIHWTLMRAGQATSVSLDQLSGAGTQTGNLQVVYAAFRGDGVYSSPNQGQSWFAMLGTTGDPLIQDNVAGNPQIPVLPLGPAPNGATKGRITLVEPNIISTTDLNNPTPLDRLYEGWLYALVAQGSALDGLYMTKDFGQNWTKVHIATNPLPGSSVPYNPSNNANLADYDPFGGQGDYDMTLGIDPTNPNVVYMGGTSNPTVAGGVQVGFIRVDTTNILDAHNAAPYSGSKPDGGLLQRNTTGGVSAKDNTKGFSTGSSRTSANFDPGTNLPYINLIRNPNNFFAESTILTQNISQFNNTGADAKWIPFADALQSSTDQHRLVTLVDPQTGHARLIFGDDQGVFTGVDINGVYVETGFDANGNMIGKIGNENIPTGSRNGNLALTQFYYGAIQPSAHVGTGTTTRTVTVYGGAQDTGAVNSTDVLGTGNLQWSGAGGDATGVATDPTGSGTVYRFIVPANAGTSFFQVNGVGRTFGLTTGPKDPQWYGPGGTGNPIVYGDTTALGNFTVNPVNGNQIIISSNVGRVFRSEDQGSTWRVIADPTTALDGTYAPALAFGAPDPTSPFGIGNLDNFIYAGTVSGRIYVTTTGGGSAGGNAWTNISNGLNGAGIIKQIITDPTRGSHDAYAVAQNGVYYIANSVPSASNPNPTWTNITGNLFQLLTPSSGDTMPTSTDTTTATQTPQLSALTSIQVDWRYLIPNVPGTPSAGTHPALYVAGNSGVYRSLNAGTTWTNFPNTDPQLDKSPVQGGYLPNVIVTSLSLSDGNINQQSGRATIQSTTVGGVTTTDPSVLAASTFGRGSFVIQLAPIVLPNSAANPNAFLFLDPTVPNNLAGTTTNGLQYTSQTNQVFDGLSEQSAFGNVVNVTAYDETPGSPNFGKPIPAADISGSSATDPNGLFSIHVNNYFTVSGTYTVGFQATDQSGTKGNIATFTFVVTGPPPAPTAVVLDPLSDSGTSNGDSYTFDNNSSTHPAPVFDVSGIQPQSTVVLLRATETNGIVGPFVVVNSVTTTTGGTVQISDTNGGNGTIADTPANTATDTAPPQPNQYVYTAYQINSLNTAGPNFAPGLGVIVDTTSPTSPTSITLNASSDSGPSNRDGYTNANNTTSLAGPVFDVTGIEPNATVVLLRDGVEVGRVKYAQPTGAMNTVQVTDTNSSAGGGQIADSPQGSPIDTLASATPYNYSVYQVDLAGNVSGVGKPVFGNQGAVVIDGTDADHHGDNLGAGGTNELGWLYMQKVLTVIQPNITNGNKILVGLGPDPALSTPSAGAAAAIYSAFNQSPLPGKGWRLVLVTGVANMQTYLNGQSAPAVDINNVAVAGGVSLAQTGLLFLPTNNHAAGDLSNAELTVLDQYGPTIANYVNGGGGLYSQGESPSTGFGRGGGGGGGGGGNAPQSYGWLSSVFPGLVAVDAGNENSIGIAITPAGSAAFSNNLQSSDLTGGPWHNYFSGILGALVVAATAPVTDPTDPSYGKNVPLILTTAGAIGNNSTALGIVIDATAPVSPALSLDAASVTGTATVPPYTQDNNGNPYPAPVFDATNVEPNATVRLYRVALDSLGNPVGAPVLVNTVTQGPILAPQTLQISDTNGGNGVIPNATYRYTVTQTDLAGNVSPAGATTVIVNAGLPPAPTQFKLEAGSDTGFSSNDGVTQDNNGNPFPAPIFDASGLLPGAKLQLFRAPVVNGVAGTAVLVNTVVSAGGGTASISDINGTNTTIPDGSYFYSTRQVDLAGNISLPSNGLSVTIDSLPPQIDPPSIPVLQAASDTGTFNNDAVTEDNNSGKFPAPKFSAGTNNNPVEAGATVQLLRTPVTAQGIPTGPTVLVNTLTDTQGGVVTISDNNAGRGTIPDGAYLYTVQLTSLAGVTGTASQGLLTVISTATPSLPAPFRLDPASDTGTSNSDGITQITLTAHPVFDAGSAAGGSGTDVLPGATLNLYRATLINGVTSTAVLANFLSNTAGGLVKISDPGSLPDGQYVYTIQQIDLAGNASAIGSPINVTYVTAQPATPPAPVLDPSNPGNSAGNQTSNTSPIIDVTVSLTGLEANSSVTLVRDGVSVVSTPYNATTGVQTLTDPGPVSYGQHTYKSFVTDLAGNKSAFSGSLTITVAANPPGTLNLDPASNTGPPNGNVTSVTNPTFDVSGTTANDTLRLLRNGQIVATIPTGANGGALKITDPGPLTSGTYTYTTQQVDASNNVSPQGPPLTITVDTSIPATPVLLQLDTATDSGSKGDNITNVKSPTFDVSGIVTGDKLQLLRNGVVVASQIIPSGTTATVTDTGPVPDGTFVYTVRQVSVAGNPSAASGGLSLTILTASPVTPAVTLDPGSNSGPPGGTTTNVSSPYFDVANVGQGNTLQLFRNGTLVKTFAHASGNPVLIQDFGPLSSGSYFYTAVQTDAAGNTSQVSPQLAITITTAQPVIPATPTLVLAPSSDSGMKGDNVTGVRSPGFSGHADPNVVVTLIDGAGVTVGTTTADTLGNFNVPVNAILYNGTYTYYAVATNSQGKISASSPPVTVKIATVQGDFTGNGNTQPALFRQTSASILQWFVLYDAQINGRAFGASSLDVPLVGDFTGLGRMDLMLYRPSTGSWTIESPTTNYTATTFLPQFGSPNIDIPVPADYLGLGKVQAAIYEPTNGYWIVRGPSGDIVTRPFTAYKAGDIPVPGNYDNTGKDELALYRPSNQTWYINGPNGVYSVAFGGVGDVPVPGAFFTTATNRAFTEAIWRPGTGQYYIRTPNGGTSVLQFAKGDIPAPGDYDGNGVTEPAVFRPGSNPPVFLVQGPTDASPRVVAPIGGTNFVPLTSPYTYRALKANGGTISAFVANSGSVNFGASAASLTAAPATGQTVLSSAASTSRPTTTAPVTAAVRTRPAQATPPPAAAGGQVEAAVLTPGVSRFRRLFGGLL